MKSFADWTQDIADRVGDVQHHWETRKEAELKASDSFEEHSWAVPGQAPVPAATQPICKCYDCGLMYTQSNMALANVGQPGHANFVYLCGQCAANRGIHP